MSYEKQAASGRTDGADITDEPAQQWVGSSGSPAASHAVFVSDLDGTISYVSRSCETFFGVAASTVVGSPMGEHLPVSTKAETVESVVEQLRRGEPVSRDLTLTAAEGCQKHLVFEATPVDCGERPTIVGTYVDRTEQHRAEAKQRLLTAVSREIGEAETYLSGVENAVQAICTHTAWTYGEVWTPAEDGDQLNFTLGYTDDPQTEPFLDASRAVSFDSGEGLPGRVYDSQSTEWIPDASEEPLEVFHRAELAAEADLRAAFGVPVIAEGTVSSVLVFFLRERCETDAQLASDVSDVVGSLGGLVERKRVADLIRQQNEQLDGFASEVAHDLRNPLSVAQGYLEIAADDPQAEALERVSDALDRMEALIENLLTLSHAGKTIGEETRISLDETASAAWANVPTATASIEIRTGRLQADPTRIQQLFENLFRNSVEHGSTASRPQAGDREERSSSGSRPQAGDSIEHGGPNVTVRVGPLDPVWTSTRTERNRVSTGFYVEDTGDGIPAAERDSIFETSYSTGGTGLGLVTVKEIAAAHGWEINCTESREGGARFEFTETATPDSADRLWIDDASR